MRSRHPADAPRPQPSSTSSWLRLITRPAPADAQAPLPKKIGLKASISEFLLVSKLRARNMLGRHGHPAASPDVADADAERAAVMSRFAHILEVTCKHWFPPEPPTAQPHRRQL